MRKRKTKKGFKRLLTIMIIAGVLVIGMAGLKVIRVTVNSETENQNLQEIPSNYTEIKESATFDEIKNNTDKNLIMFTSNWCGACARMKEELKELAKELTNINFYVADIEGYRSYANEYSVAITPALVLIEKTSFETIQEIRAEQLEQRVREFELLGI